MEQNRHAIAWRLPVHGRFVLTALIERPDPARGGVEARR
jgi:hypothetical protein